MKGVRLSQWKRVLEKMERIVDSFVVDLIMTPCEHFVSANYRLTIGEALTKTNNFDQLPVVNDDGTVVGLVFVVDIEQRRGTDPVSFYCRDLGLLPPVSVQSGLIAGLSMLLEYPARLVTDQDEIVGLLHRSDFNRHAARVYFYTLLSILEIGLAAFIEENYEEPEWLALLEDAKGQELQSVGTEKLRENTKLNLIEYLDLSDMVNVLAQPSAEKERALLGFDSIEAWKKFAGGLVDLRHSVMHPVRTLVKNQSSAETLIRRDRRLRDLADRLTSALVELAEGR